jgi:hypothetical protein
VVDWTESDPLPLKRAIGRRGFHRGRLPNALRAAATYLSAVFVGDLAWESLHLPLYTIWQDGTLWQRVFAVAHCTAGDVLIATTAFVLSLAIAGGPEWPARHFARVALLASVLGIGYTVFSEWMNVHVHNTWTYSQLMPVISLEGVTIGLSPTLQWCVVPLASFLLVRHFVLGRSR